MEPQFAMPQDTTFVQEYQLIDNSANLNSEFFWLRIHDMFLVAKNRNVKKSGDLKKSKCISCNGCFETDRAGLAAICKVELGKQAKKED
jgi:hypothetical protein